MNIGLRIAGGGRHRGGGGGGGPTIVQSIAGDRFGANCSVTLGAPAATANMILAFVRVVQSFGAVSCTGLTDDAGNTYTLLRSDASESGANITYVYYCLAVTGTPQTFTNALSGSTLNSMIEAVEINGATGIDTSTFDDCSGTPWTGAGITTSYANELLICFASEAASHTVAVGTGWTDHDHGTLSAFVRMDYELEQKTMATAGSFTPAAVPSSSSLGSLETVAIRSDIVTPTLIASAQFQDAFNFATSNQTPSIDTTGADFLVIAISQQNNSGTNATVTDTKGNTWYPLSKSGYNGNCQLFYAWGAVTVGTFHRVTVACAGGLGASITFSAWSGIKTSGDPLVSGSDVQGSSVGGGATTVQPGSVTPSAAHDLIICGCGGIEWGGPASIDSSFSIIENESSGGATNYYPAAMFALIAPNTSAVDPTITVTANPSNIASAIAIFKHG